MINRVQYQGDRAYIKRSHLQYRSVIGFDLVMTGGESLIRTRPRAANGYTPTLGPTPVVQSAEAVYQVEVLEEVCQVEGVEVVLQAEVVEAVLQAEVKGGGNTQTSGIIGGAPLMGRQIRKTREPRFGSAGSRNLEAEPKHADSSRFQIQ
ncbi:Hypothetical predicted protein [Mytilus galloprovincialis]|uniref:Uncharacterized protein n=1 Tax=Mytilus galloprovincialis TaxID=29158 RepID=A0A8B6CXL8_MYTGA|nr:Hypothetical predicted protein [Mytilus galloprovincialis]